MNAILVDDEPSNLENLSQLLSKHCPEVRISGTARNITEATSLIIENLPDLIFLDIQLMGESGFDLLRQIEEITFEVIFVTAHDQYGIHAVKFAALDYLLKPIDINELKTAVSKAGKKVAGKIQNKQLAALREFLQAGTERPIRIALPLHNEVLYVTVSEIVRCEASNTYTFFYLKTGERVLVSRTLKEYTEILTPYGFIRCHQSHLINVYYVKSWLKEDGGVLLLRDQTKVPVSRPNREYVKEQLQRQLGR